MERTHTPEKSVVPGYYVWTVPGKSVSVHLNLDVIDRMSGEVMTGFGAIPRRGAEVGGILIGSIEGGVVKVDDFEPVPCEYKRGPSYFLSEPDAASFQEAFDRVRPGPAKEQYAVGFYRSNTRDQVTLSEEDRKLCSRYFPAPSNVVLMIKPYASKVSTAGFITYEDGRLDDESALDFPFRRYELEGTAPPARRPLSERGMRPEPSAMMRSPAPSYEAPPSDERPAAHEQTAIDPEPERSYAVTAESSSTRRKGWAWVPLSFIFLMLGLALGFLSAISIYPKGPTPTVGDPYALMLSVEQSDDNLHVKWDRQSAAIRAAQRGVLEITDGSYAKTVDLDATQMQNGSVIYRHLSNKVNFKLEVFPRDRISVTQRIDWP
jgi:hypothetical protein